MTTDRFPRTLWRLKPKAKRYHLFTQRNAHDEAFIARCGVDSATWDDYDYGVMPDAPGNAEMCRRCSDKCLEGGEMRAVKLLEVY